MTIDKKVEDLEAAKRLINRLYEADRSSGMLKKGRIGMHGSAVTAIASKTKGGYTVEITTVWSEYTLKEIFEEVGI